MLWLWFVLVFSMLFNRFVFYETHQLLNNAIKCVSFFDVYLKNVLKIMLCCLHAGKIEQQQEKIHGIERTPLGTSENDRGGGYYKQYPQRKIFDFLVLI